MMSWNANELKFVTTVHRASANRKPAQLGLPIFFLLIFQLINLKSGGLFLNFRSFWIG